MGKKEQQPVGGGGARESKSEAKVNKKGGVKGLPQKMRRVGTVNSHVRVEGNGKALGYVIRERVNLDVCVVTETWLKEEEHTAEVVFQQSGYDWIGVERKGKRGGGIGVLVRKGLEWEKVKEDSDNVLWVRVKGIGYVAAVYLPPTGRGTTVTEVTRVLRQIAMDAKKFGADSQVVVAGDFNARIGELKNEVAKEEARERKSQDKVVDARGKRLMKLMNKAGLYVVNGVKEEADFTFEHANGEGASVIDLIWVSESAEVGTCEEWSEASCCIGDHSLVAVDIQGRIEEVEVKKRKEGWNKVTEEWKKEAEPWFEWSEDKKDIQVDKLWSRWKQLFVEEATELVGKKKARVEKHHEGVWSQHVKELVVLKNKMRKRGQPLKEIQRMIRAEKARIRAEVALERNAKLKEQRKQNPRGYWMEINKLMGRGKRGIAGYLTFKGKEVKGKGKMEAWGEMFQGEQMCPGDEEMERKVETRKAENWKMTHGVVAEGLDEEIQLEEVKIAIKRLKSGKAPGEDSITAELLKGANERCIEALWKVFKRCYEEEELPEEWARGLVVPIPKTTDGRKIENYRGISLMSIVGKVFVSVLNARLKTWMEKHRVVVEEQAGFREGHAAVDQVYVLSEIIQRQKKRKKPYYLAFLDIKRAYDVVWRDGLWDRLWSCGVKGRLWRVVQKLYEKTVSCVVVEDQKTEWKRSDVGVRQGCVMSPNLFSMFINGMATTVKGEAKGIRWADKKLSILLFADDVVLMAEEESDMDKMLKVVHTYSKEWRFQFNAQKCKVMANRARKEGSWKMGEEKIAEVDSFVYLGVEFGKGPRWKEMKKKVMGKIEGRIRKVEMLRQTFGLGTKEALRVWDVVGRPVMEYGSEVWATGGWKEGEEAMYKFGKRLIGMRRNTNKEVVQGELGRMRMKGRWDLARIRLWNKLVAGRNPLASWVYKQRREEFERQGRKDKRNWCWYTWQVLKELKREVDWTVEHTGEEWLQRVKEEVRAREEEEWKSRMEAKPRLRTYRLAKDKLQHEKYLDCTSGAKRKVLIELRSGANDLEIDKGRREKKEVKDRMCEECKGDVEDEMHLLLECPVYFYTREEMFEVLERCGVKVARDEPREVIWRRVMGGTTKGQWKVVGKYAARMMEQREAAKRLRGAQG